MRKLDVFAFHPEVDALFRSAGWLPERRVDVATWHAKLADQGVQLFPVAEPSSAALVG